MTIVEHGSQQVGGVALSHPGTQQALARYRRHWTKVVRTCLTVTGLAGVGFLLALIGMVVLDRRAGPDIAAAVVFLSFIAGFVAAVLAAIAWGQLRAGKRIEWMLAHHPWQRRARYHFRPGAKRQILVIDADEVGPAATCQLNGGSRPGWSSVGRLQAGAGHQPLLVAGDPLQWAVGSTADMGDLFTLQPVRLLG